MALISFQLNYHTHWGEQVCLCGSASELGGFNEDKAIVLSNNGDTWSAEIEHQSDGFLYYYYFIREGKLNVRREWGEHRVLFLKKGNTFFVRDLWKSRPYHHYLYSGVFTDSVFYHETALQKPTYHSRSILLHVICPYVKKEEQLYISGECNTLGNWDIRKALPLSYIRHGEWQILLNAEDFTEDAPYKFVIADAVSRKEVHWEDGGNRILKIDKNLTKNSIFVEMGLLFHHTRFLYKGTGTAIPVFSLRSDESFGIGDFLDLKKIIDWASLTNQQLIQVLPINDTTTTKTWQDSYPYSAISIYALHPMYLGCTQFPLKDKNRMKKYADEAKSLNQLSELDYEKVFALKTNYCRELFLQDGENVINNAEYAAFYKKNEHWLFPYSCYCYLRDKHRTARFADWGEFSEYDKNRLQRMIDRHPEALNEMQYYGFLQFLLHRQLSEVKNYAHTKAVALKGDIPIGINRDSVEAWTDSHLFNMDTQTGAPPDDFSIYGQNWRFPTHNWRAMEEDNYAWWKNRFRKMTDYFDAYRIDHILGFFRIWEIPLDAVQGLLGYFSPALPYWAEELIGAGIPFDEERMAKPFIHEDFLNDIFGEYTEDVKNTYLDVSGWKCFNLRSFCDTQKKVQHLFADKNDAKSNRLRDGLYTLCAQVLFVRDRNDHHRFHPRITAQYTYSYRYLDDTAKNAFNCLYDDFYYHRHNYFWREQAMKKLPELISSSRMLVCGEDLGMVPDCVPSVMNEMQILSLEIQRMPKDPNVLFTQLNTLPYLSVCSTSTHDMSPIRAWWNENRELTQRYYTEVLHQHGEAPQECTPEICLQILQQHAHASAMWVIFPLQDWLSMDKKLRNPDAEAERVNIPANPEHYWRYRMHISLDKLLKEDAFNENVRRLSLRN